MITQHLSAPKRRSSAQRRLAEKLFVREEFSTIKFRDMELEDWKIHASRAWEVAGAFIEEMKRRKKSSLRKSPKEP